MQKFSNTLPLLLILTLLNHVHTQQILTLNTTQFPPSPLLPTDRGNFGSSVDISPDGQYAVVSADVARNLIGTVFYFKQNFSSGEWTEVNEVLPNDVKNDGDYGFQPLFGTAVKLWENRLAVSAPNFNSSLGAVYMFEWQNGTWVQNQRIDGNINGYSFGEALAFEGDWLLASSSNIQLDEAVVYVYKYSELNQTWEFHQFLYPNAVQSYGFGSSLDISGTNAIAVQHRAFRNSGTGVSIYGLTPNGTWVNETFLPFPEAYCPSATLYRDMIMVSCNNGFGGTSNGIVHILRHLQDGTWGGVTDIIPTDPRGYGNLIVASGNRIAVGAEYSSMVYWGSVYTYVYQELVGTQGPDGSTWGTWVPEFVIFPETNQFASFFFGSSVAVFPTGILIGAEMSQGGRGSEYYLELPLIQDLTSLTNVTADFPQLLVMQNTSLFVSNITVIRSVVIYGKLELENTMMNVKGNLTNNGQMVITFSSPNEPITIEDCLEGSGTFHIILPPVENDYQILKYGCHNSNSTNITILVSYINFSNQDLCHHISYSVQYLSTSVTVSLTVSGDSCTQWQVSVVVGSCLVGGFFFVVVVVVVCWVKRREKKYNKAMKRLENKNDTF